ncbi:MAG: histidine kinase [Deltaproteobacteria bacterium]|nr:MAG: histidine kinase [Deltaproteobacteria bacterium]
MAIESITKKIEEVKSKGSTHSADLLWARFVEASTARNLCEAWLALQSSRIQGVHCGLVLLGAPDEGPFVPMATWPDSTTDARHLSEICEKALRERRGIFSRSPESSIKPAKNNRYYHVACPIEVHSRVFGVVSLEVEPRPESELKLLLRELFWGIAWLQNLILKQSEAETTRLRDRLETVLDLVAASLEEDHFQAAAISFVTELSTKLGCERVSYGSWNGKKIRIHAISHTSDFGKKMNVVSALSSVMEEAIDQYSTIVYPGLNEEKVLVDRAHSHLADSENGRAICTVPLIHNEKVIGAITLERTPDKPFDQDTVELLETLFALTGPILEEKRKENRWLIRKILDSFNDQVKKLVGPSHYALKLITVCVAALIIFFCFAKGDYRVTAQSALEGAMQMSVSAPFDGYILKAPARAGDVVHKDDLLTILDDRDLRIEQLKLKSQIEELSKSYRKAMAEHDRAQIRIVNSQLQQIRAKLNLINEHLARTQIKAPFDAVVISGDLSQSIGSPVERGQELYKIAPLEGYRIILQVEEKDIDEVTTGQKGELVLSAMPDTTFPFTVTEITPVAISKEGKNFFRVEARLEKKSARLRPGMEGVAKIYVDERKLIWIWTHDIIDWLKIKLWKWWP